WLTRRPETFVAQVRPALNSGPCEGLTLKPQYTMMGRTYSLGYEPDLTETLLDRPRRTVLNPAWGWAVWYPLRRSGRFAQLSDQEQRTILAEHGAIGMSFGAADYAHDIRLACHGLDRDDNDFVIGLIGKDLFPLSAVVQAMRKTQQTALYLDRLGPFFTGRVVWQPGIRCDPLPAGAVFLPDSAVSLPDTAVSVPDSAVSLPDSAVSVPDSAVSVPDSEAPTGSGLASNIPPWFRFARSAVTSI